MDILLLIFFALPIAVVIISIALQKILKCPALVAAIIFAIFLIVTFIISNLNFLIATIVYTIISYITVVIAHFICRFLRNRDCDDNCICGCRRDRENNWCNCGSSRETNNRSNDLLRISSCCQNGDSGQLLTISSNGSNWVRNDLLTVNSSCMRNNEDDENNECNEENCSNDCCDCGNSNDNNNTVSARVRVIPNNNTDGRTGSFSGSYRRRN